MSNIGAGDANHSIIRSFDDATDSLRTTLTNASVEIAVSAFTDSIKIGDTTGQTATITDLGGGVKALDVNIADVQINHASDSVRLGDGTNLLTSTLEGGKRALDVSLVNPNLSGSFTQAPAGATVLEYGNVPSLAIGGTTTVVSYIVGMGDERYVQKVYVSSTQVATFVFKLNGNTILTTRMNPTNFSQTMDFSTGSAFGIHMLPGDVVAVEATNDGNAIAEVNSTIQFMEV